ncbi:MAG: hypothetical protein EOP51_34470 [Sphingobacteriales bacterium]|nr:MAG: hypothetical protein EOP51_34470 [Sphingobacteriales bacterium]
MQKLFLVAFICMTCFTLTAQNADSTWFVNNYTKKEVYIGMRDGIKLFTSIYIPNDNTEKHPFIMTRTPYSCAPYGPAYVQIWNSYRMQYAREQTLDLANTLAGDSVSSFKVSLHAPGGNLVAFNSNNVPSRSFAIQKVVFKPVPSQKKK